MLLPGDGFYPCYRTYMSDRNIRAWLPGAIGELQPLEPIRSRIVGGGLDSLLPAIAEFEPDCPGWKVLVGGRVRASDDSTVPTWELPWAWVVWIDLDGIAGGLYDGVTVLNRLGVPPPATVATGPGGRVRAFWFFDVQMQSHERELAEILESIKENLFSGNNAAATPSAGTGRPQEGNARLGTKGARMSHH